jgi:hypothetical protein
MLGHVRFNVPFLGFDGLYPENSIVVLTPLQSRADTVRLVQIAGGRGFSPARNKLSLLSLLQCRPDQADMKKTVRNIPSEATFSYSALLCRSTFTSQHSEYSGTRNTGWMSLVPPLGLQCYDRITTLGLA